MEKIMMEMENAAGLLMAPPGAVSNDERHNAEQYFIKFRKTSHPYDICKHLLGSCKNDYVLFEAVTTIKESIIREWSILEKEKVDDICSFLLCCATENPNLQNYVREQILYVVAIIFKLGTLEDIDARSKLIAHMSQLLTRGNKTMVILTLAGYWKNATPLQCLLLQELISCSIMKALLTEYSTTDKSTSFGMSLEFHSKCKKSFEEKDLLNVFILAVQTLQKYTTSTISALSRQDVAIFVRYLSLAEQILNWDFLYGNILSLVRMYTVHSEMAPKIIFRPHKGWRKVVLESNLLDLFFKLFQISLSNSELCHYCLQCLIQLASISGGIFPDDETQTKYLEHYIALLLSSIGSNHHWTGHQALGLSNIINRLVDVFPFKVIIKLSHQTVASFLEAMTYLTCNFQEAALLNMTDLDDNEYAEAYNNLFDAWAVLIAHTEDFPKDLFSEYAVKIFEMYLKTHLSPPDGVKNIENDKTFDDEIECDNTEEDRDEYADELTNLGHIARKCLPYVLNLMINKYQSRIDMLMQVFNTQKQGKSIEHPKSIEALFEDLHWLTLITSFTLTFDNPSESPQIPDEVITFTNEFLQSHPNTVRVTTRYLTSIGKEGNISEVDSVIAIYTSVLRIIEIEMEYLKNQAMSAFSPGLAATLLWFQKRFVRSYLLLNDTTQLKLSPTLSACFYLKNDCGKLVLKLLLEVIEINLLAWSGEPLVGEDTVKLLLRLLADNKRASVAVEYSTVWSIAKMFSLRAPAVLALPIKTQRLLSRSLMTVCNNVEEKEKEELHKLVLQPILLSYQEIRSKPDFNKVSQETHIKQEVLRIIDCLTGLAPACSGLSVDRTFEFLRPILEDLVNLIKVYANVTLVIISILELFVTLIEGWLCFLSKAYSSAICKICLHLIENYARQNQGKTILGRFEEEEQYEDILLMIQLLTHILARDYLAFFDGEGENASGPDDIAPVDCVLAGLNFVIPLINQELMKYPNLCREYFKLVTFVCEVYPEKMKQLPQDLFQLFMTSIQMAITEYGNEIGKCGLDAISSLAKYYFNECDHNDPINHQLYVTLQQFLNMVFQHVVLGSFNMDLIEPAAESLFLLICCHQQEYLKLANNLITQQEVQNEKFKKTLIEAFEILTPTGLQLTPNRRSLKIFRKNLEEFLASVKGFLCYK